MKFFHVIRHIIQTKTLKPNLEIMKWGLSGDVFHKIIAVMLTFLFSVRILVLGLLRWSTHSLSLLVQFKWCTAILVPHGRNVQLSLKT